MVYGEKLKNTVPSVTLPGQLGVLKLLGSEGHSKPTRLELNLGLGCLQLQTKIQVIGKKKTKERRRRNRFFQVIKSRRSQSFQKCNMNLFRLCMLLPIVNKTTVLKFLRGPRCWYFRVDVNYDQLCIRLECNK